MSFNELPYFEKVIRPSTVLTTSYVLSDLIAPEVVLGNVQVDSLNQLILLVDLTLGSLTSAEIKILVSNDGATGYQTSLIETTAGSGIVTVRPMTYTFPASGQYQIAMPIKAERIVVLAKGTGTITGSLMAITAIVGQV